MTDDIHSCSYYCDRPECVKAQRDELHERLDALIAEADSYRRQSDAWRARYHAAVEHMTDQALQKATADGPQNLILTGDAQALRALTADRDDLRDRNLELTAITRHEMRAALEAALSAAPNGKIEWATHVSACISTSAPLFGWYGKRVALVPLDD